MLQKLIQELGRDLMIETNIQSKESQRYLVPLDDIEVEISEFKGNYLLRSIIAPLPNEETESVLLKVLEADLFGIGTKKGVIGLNKEGKVLTLSMELDYNSSYKDFKEKLEDFITVVDHWRHRVLHSDKS
jgi:hypothetical protein